MKKSIFLMVMVVVFIGLMAGSAFATRYDSTYATFTGSPHGTYSTATNKCAACHAVHNPGGASGGTEANRNTAITASGSEALLRSSIGNACTYCHVSNNFVIKTVYAELQANYTGANTNAHSFTGGPGSTMSDTNVSCTNCHQVHGAASMMVAGDLYMQKKILKTQATVDPDAPAYAANGVGSVNDTNMSRWCSGCHNYYEIDYNQNSHIMTVAAGDYNNPSATNKQHQAVAWKDSSSCRSCHADGVTNQAAATNGANNYPHYTSGYRFLREATSSGVASAAAGPTNDGQCLICHAFNGATGVGLDF